MEKVFIVNKTLPAVLNWQYTVKAETTDDAVMMVMRDDVEHDDYRVMSNMNMRPGDFAYDVEEVQPD